MEVPSKTEVKKIISDQTKKHFDRIDLELIYLRKQNRLLNEEIKCLKQYKYKGGKNGK